MTDHSPRRSEYRFGDDTTVVTTPADRHVKLSPEAAQPEPQDTASFLVSDTAGQVVYELTASHFSSGNRAANLDKFRAIIEQKLASATAPQVVMGDINTEIKTAEHLQAFADETGMVMLIPSLKIRRLRGLQDQLHKRMDRKDEYDSMFVALEPHLVDAATLTDIPHQNVAWPNAPERLRWKTLADDDVAQAWMDDRILTDHGVLKCPLAGGGMITLGNVARANYDKYDIKNEAQITRHAYLRGQEVIETQVVAAVRRFIAKLPVSPTLDAELKASTLDAFQAYQDGLSPRYQAAYDAWDEADDLCDVASPLGRAMDELGTHAKRFVSIARALSWEDIRDAADARTAFENDLTEALITGLGVGSDDTDKPLGGHPGFHEDAFRAKSVAKIRAAWERIIKRQSAGDLYKMWFAELLRGQTTGGMPIPSSILARPTEDYIDERKQALGLAGTVCVIVEALR
jgi:hypothetical protein